MARPTPALAALAFVASLFRVSPVVSSGGWTDHAGVGVRLVAHGEITGLHRR
jgi:hypothetical protein